tara:strand:+ start:4657 stop:6564 length:1908 start_codon:yes stop_codon:yes gene_type:complete
MKKLSILLVLFVIWSANSQELEKYKKLYPNAVFVRLQQEIVINIKLNDGKFDIRKDIFEEDLYLNESANYNSKRSLSYSSFFDLDKIEASSLSYTGKKYEENKVVDFNEKNDLNDSFYDDSKEVSFIYPKLKKGSKTNLRLSYNIKNPRFLSAFFFGDFYPVINNKVTIIADKNIEFKFKEFNTDSTQIEFKKKKKGKNFIYTWTTKNNKEYDIEGNAPNYKTILPHIIPMITSYKDKKEDKKLLDGVGGLYKWYYSLVENINKETDDVELIALVEELTKGKTSDLEKVKAIYYWTQQNIKYIAFEYALGGFIPREANDVFKKKYGDCKDNSSILYKMLEIAGLKGNLTWIGTRSIPYTYEEVPTPAVDNHMILSYEENGKTYYLDATGRYIQINYPSSFIQGKEALVSYGSDFKIKKVPVISANLNTIVDSTFIKISNRDIIGRSSTKLTGYIKNNMFYNLENFRKNSDIKELYNKRFSKGNNKFLIKSFEEINKYSYEDDFIVNYDFSIQGYAQNIGSEIFINPHLNKSLSSLKTKKDRKHGIEFDYKKQYSYTNVIEIPEGYKVEYIPESTTFTDDLISVKFSYKVDGNNIISQQEVILNFILLSVEQQKTVNTIIEKAEKAYKEIIILKKK